MDRAADDWTSLKLLLVEIQPKRMRRRYEIPDVQSRNTRFHPYGIYNIGMQINDQSNAKNVHPLTRIVLYTVLAFGIAIALLITVRAERELAMLERTAQTADGVLIAKQCSDHGFVSFKYTVARNEYTSSSNACGISCTNATVGDPIKVIYSARDPRIARCTSLTFSKGHIKHRYRNIAIIGFALFIGIFFQTRAKKTPRDSARGRH